MQPGRRVLAESLDVFRSEHVEGQDVSGAGDFAEFFVGLAHLLVVDDADAEVAGHLQQSPGVAGVLDDEVEVVARELARGVQEFDGEGGGRGGRGQWGIVAYRFA